MGQRSAPAPFLTKTYELVDDESVDDVVSWSETGATFVVWKTADFARDLLPVYFKHNNFSSFVRQLNTYGFRKIATDKWEFANDYFRRGQKELLTGIRRRKAVVTPQAPNMAAGKKNCEVPSPSNSGENVGSTSASSPDSKNPGSVGTVNTDQYADLSGENEKLRKDNESLSSELALAKSRCDELIGFLTEYLKVEPDQINRIVRQGSCGSSRDGDRDGGGCGSGESVKLFGVWVGEKEKEKKRGRGEWDQEEKMECHGPHKETKLTVDFHCGPLMKISKVCNL